MLTYKNNSIREHIKRCGGLFCTVRFMLINTPRPFIPPLFHSQLRTANLPISKRSIYPSTQYCRL